MTGCRCCVFLTIFTLSVVFGKSFPKHVSLVKARFGDTLGYGAAGNRSRVQRRGFRLTVFLDLTCPVPRLRRADLLAAPRVAFLLLFVGRLQVDPIRATGDSLAGHLCGLVSTRPLSSVSGLVLDFEGRVFALPRARLCFDIEAYCPLIFGLARPGHPPPSRARICATRVAFLCAFPNPVKPRRQARVSLEIVTSLSQALRTFELAPRAPRSVP
ncbi:unnamed protein product [Effrenium voratum]|uniref:Secreted protein n=2 Tax=Effrenium voratum TaxID=2562239 RepID=A0AA36MR91_9DINO|nr:unnamed protein product [Effrenium voratum]